MIDQIFEYNMNKTERITPEMIDSLKKGEIFVFGSNMYGNHAGGAARFAVQRFGAIWGQGEGLQGQSYAIPTMEGMSNMIPAINRFIAFAKEHQEFRFYVTAIACGIAGYTPEEIAPHFKDAASLENVCLPLSFWDVIGG